MTDSLPSEWLTMPDAAQFARVTVTLAVAAFLGGVLGFEREQWSKPAGLRTHMLVSLGAALFTMAPLEAGMSIQELGRVTQGVAAGIGFLGAGTILKLTRRREIQGLTTAAGIWLTAAVGMAVGAGRLWIPVMGVALAVAILGALGRIEARLARNASTTPDPQPPTKP
jgi:putative Mg2+ transporter-C (MgtC) family protein